MVAINRYYMWQLMALVFQGLVCPPVKHCTFPKSHLPWCSWLLGCNFERTFNPFLKGLCNLLSKQAFKNDGCQLSNHKSDGFKVPPTPKTHRPTCEHEVWRHHYRQDYQTNLFFFFFYGARIIEPKAPIGLGQQSYHWAMPTAPPAPCRKVSLGWNIFWAV